MERKERVKFVKEFCEVNAISGHEKEASRVFKKYVEGYADEIDYDNLGSIIARQGNGPVKIMIAGHLDEVGFLVKSIDNNGFIRIHPIGGWWGHVVMAQRFVITTRTGKEYLAVSGSTAPHGMPAEARLKVRDIADMYLDLGVKNKEEVEKLGIKIGDPITPYSKFEELANNKYWLCKAFDNRIGCAVGVEVLRNLKGVNHPNTVYACGTVQEEVGCRGARTCAYKVHPDIAFALDVTLSNDAPGANANLEAKLGAGVAISYGDGSVIGHTGLIELLDKICEEKKIPFTHDILQAGGTDSGEIHKSFDGVVNCTISIPCRYIHSHTSIMHEDDYVAAIDLITEFCKRCDSKMLAELKETKK